MTKTRMKKRLRTVHFSWPDDASSENLFGACITIDPTEIVRAWALLSSDTWELEVAGYPALFHESLRAALVARATGERERHGKGRQLRQKEQV